MDRTAFLRRTATAGTVAVLTLIFMVPLSAAARGNHFTVDPLVSDNGVPGTNVDPNLVNAWGLAAGPSTPWWVADNATKVSTLYDGAGNVIPLVVTVGGGPTGLVYNGSASDFIVSDGTNSGSALFIFASEDGMIRGWSPAVPPPPFSTQTEVAVDRSAEGAIYKGLAIADGRNGPRLYAADFHNARVDVFDGSWNLIRRRHAFVDRKLPDGFAPFGIQAIGSHIFVSYAKQDAAAKDELAGQGLGFVDAYDLAGHLQARVARRGLLNAPWGLARAPSSFGRFGGDLLVGNFGNGRINAYGNEDGRFEHEGQLRTGRHQPVAIDGLWALEFGNGDAAGPKNTLFFTAGPGDES
ncbi:MAG: TIGR03118 family protein, partial [Actinobacteria bacterium]